MRVTTNGARPQLDPKAADMLEEVRVSGRPNAHLLPVAQARRNFEDLFAGLGPGEPVASMQDLEIDGPHGSIPCRLYRPHPGGDLPLLVYFHGGGWLLGSIESHDIITRALCVASGAAVVSVGYRLAPEYKFPVALDECVSVVHWLHGHGADLGVDPGRIALAGDSAGGNLAIASALRIRDEGAGPHLVFLLLVYPVVTTDLSDASWDDRFEGYFLYRDELAWHQSHYLSHASLGANPYVSVLDADLRDLPPALVICAGCDPLHLQGERLRERLAAAEVLVTCREYAGMIHGFFGLDSLFAASKDAMRGRGRRVAGRV